VFGRIYLRKRAVDRKRRGHVVKHFQASKKGAVSQVLRGIKVCVEQIWEDLGELFPINKLPTKRQRKECYALVAVFVFVA